MEGFSGKCLICFSGTNVLRISPDRPLLPKDRGNVKKIVLTFDANRFSYFFLSVSSDKYFIYFMNEIQYKDRI